jgi:hypothetical protein
MIERTLTQREREFALARCVCGKVPQRREFRVGFLFATALAAPIVWIVVFVLVPFIWTVPTAIAITMVAGSSIAAGIAGGVSAANTAKANNKTSAQIADTIRRDVEANLVHVYSGKVADASFDERANPEHPDIHISFIDGDQVRLTIHEQYDHRIHEPPKAFAQVAILPHSRLIVSVEAT